MLEEAHVTLLKVVHKDSAQHKEGCYQCKFHAGTAMYRGLPLPSTHDTLISDSTFHRMKAPWRNAHTVLLLTFRTQVSFWFLVAPQELFVYVFLFKRALSLEKGRGFKECGS